MAGGEEIGSENQNFCSMVRRVDKGGGIIRYKVSFKSIIVFIETEYDVRPYKLRFEKNIYLES